MPIRKTERVSAGQRAIGAALILAVALAGAYLLYSRIWLYSGNKAIVAMRPGNDTVAIKGHLSDDPGAANKPCGGLVFDHSC